MSLDWRFECDENTRDRRREAYPPRDGNMNSVTYWLIMSGIHTRVHDWTTVTARDEAFRRIAFYETLMGAVCQTAEGPRPITREDVEAHRGLITNCFPLTKWSKFAAHLSEIWADNQAIQMHAACDHPAGYCTVAWDGVPDVSKRTA